MKQLLFPGFLGKKTEEDPNGYIFVRYVKRKDGKIIWPGALMGVESDGMLCGFRELRLKNAPDKKGLWIIPDDWQEVGEAVDFAKANTFFPAK